MLVVSVFALCAVGALLGWIVPDRRNPALLGWFGALAAIAALWISADVLRSGVAFQTELWTIAPLGTLRISLDRLAALFLLVAAAAICRAIWVTTASRRSLHGICCCSLRSS